MQRAASAILACLLVLAVPAAAQQAQSARAEPLEARMRQFLAALDGESRIEADAYDLVPFFPRQGDWQRVVTTHRGPRGDTVTVERFRTAEMHAASMPGGRAQEVYVFVPGAPGTAPAP